MHKRYIASFKYKATEGQNPIHKDKCQDEKMGLALSVLLLFILLLFDLV